MADTSGNDSATGTKEVEADVPSKSVEQPEKKSTNQAETTNKKRKQKTESRAATVWEHFGQLKDDSRNLVKAKCLYYVKIFKAEHKKHGTLSLKNHILSYLKNPHIKDTRQSLLTLKPDSVKTEGTDSTRVLGIWKFDQEAVRGT